MRTFPWYAAVWRHVHPPGSDRALTSSEESMVEDSSTLRSFRPLDPRAYSTSVATCSRSDAAAASATSAPVEVTSDVVVSSIPTRLGLERATSDSDQDDSDDSGFKAIRSRGGEGRRRGGEGERGGEEV